MKNKMVLTVLAIIIVGLGLFWLLNRQKTTVTSKNEATAPTQRQAEQVLGEITANPEKFLGQQVKVSGEVGQVLGVNAIILKTPGEIINDQILVIAQAPMGSTSAEVKKLYDQQQVELSGTVSQFSYDTYKDTLDLNIQPEVMVAYEGKPFILTDRIRPVVSGPQ